MSKRGDPWIMVQVAADTTAPSDLPLSSTACFIERDFQELVGCIERAIELIDSSDRETAIRLAKTRCAAERGVILSKQLSRIAH